MNWHLNLFLCSLLVLRWTQAADQLKLKVEGVKSREAVLLVLTNNRTLWTVYVVNLIDRQNKRSTESRWAAQSGNVTRINLTSLGPNTLFSVRVRPVKSYASPEEKWTDEIKFKTLGTSPAIHGLVSSLHARAGRRADISCNATGHPPPTVTWYKSVGLGYRELAKGRLLALTNVTLDTEGLYKCVATNGNKPDVEGSVMIQVIAPPVINVKPKDQEIKLGDPFSLTCSAKGRPVPLIRWYKDGEFIQRGESFTVVRVSSRHEGTYRCEASNDISNTTDVAYANVVIIYKPQNMTISATVAKSDMISCKLGQTVTLRCHGDSRYAVSYEWIKEDRVIARQRETQVTLNTQSAFGPYKCQASNKAGSSTSVIRVVSQDGGQEESDVPQISIPSTHFWIAAGCLGGLMVCLVILISILIRRKKMPIYETPLDVDSPAQGPRQRDPVILRGTNNRRSNPRPSPISEPSIPPLNSARRPSWARIYTSLLPRRDYMHKARRSEAAADYVNVSAGYPQPSAANCADYEEPRPFSFGRRKGPRYPR